MKEKFIKFIESHNVEYNWFNNGHDLYLFVNCADIADFNSMFDRDIYLEFDIVVIMKKGYFTFEMSPIFDYYGLKLTDIFEKNDRVYY